MNKKSFVFFSVLAALTISVSVAGAAEACGYIKVNKITLPTDTTTQFSIAAQTTGGSILDPKPTSIHGGQSVMYWVEPQSVHPYESGTYSVIETLPADSAWVMVSNTCQDLVVKDIMQTVECTITNAKKGAITIVKNAIGADGTFPFSSNFGITSLTTTSGTVSQTFDKLIPGNYNISEGAVAGWTSDGGVCVSSIAGKAQTPGNIVLEPGETVTCTFTNTAVPPKLTLDKKIVNDDGGPAKESDWTLTADGGAAGKISGPGAVGDADVVSDGTFKAGTYVLSEALTNSAFKGLYTPSQWSCVKNGQSAVLGSSIDLALGDTAVCTITNDDTDPGLKLVKSVDNTNGGTATAHDWDLSATGATRSFTDKGDSDKFYPVTTGIPYTLSEALTNPAFAGLYSSSEWSCVKNGQPAVLGSSITLALGDSAVCTITNTSIAPTLQLNKIVLGGSAKPGDWDLTATGDAMGFTEAGDATSTYPVTAGVVYTLSESSETVLSGYNAASAWECSGGTLVNGNQITLALNQKVKCTITNSATKAKLTLVKNPICGGGITVMCQKPPVCVPAPASDWTLSATVVGASDPTITGQSGSTATVDAGDYVLSEAGTKDADKDYAPVGWSCVDKNNVTMPVTAEGKVTLAPDVDATCTITNQKSLTPPVVKTGKIKVVKYTIGANDLTFNFNLNNATSTVPFSIETNQKGWGNMSWGAWSLEGLNVGVKYQVVESAMTGWQQVMNTCKNVFVWPGRTTTCVIVNKKVQQHQPCGWNGWGWGWGVNKGKWGCWPLVTKR